MPSAAITNALTIDVEDYFQVSAFAPYIERTDWERRECRVERNVDRILELLDEHDAQATFFTLGWIAERYPHLVRRIADQGHEVASHGYGHEVSDLDRAAFDADIRRQGLLEDQRHCGRLPRRAFPSGRAILGLRQPRPGRPRTARAFIRSARPLRHARRAALHDQAASGLIGS